MSVSNLSPESSMIDPFSAACAVEADLPAEVEDDDRQRMDKFLPGDILDRDDNDGIFAVSDLFAAGATIRFKVNPHRAVGAVVPWNTDTGVATWRFTAVFWGYKIVQPIQV